MSNLSDLFGDKEKAHSKTRSLNDLFGESKPKAPDTLQSLFGGQPSSKRNGPSNGQSAADGQPLTPEKAHGDSQAFQALFDDEVPDAHFCRDCVHYMYHPFGSRCCLKNKPAEPLGDCDQFSLRQSGLSKEVISKLAR